MWNSRPNKCYRFAKATPKSRTSSPCFWSKIGPCANRINSYKRSSKLRLKRFKSWKSVCMSLNDSSDKTVKIAVSRLPATAFANRQILGLQAAKKGRPKVTTGKRSTLPNARMKSSSTRSKLAPTARARSKMCRFTRSKPGQLLSLDDLLEYVPIAPIGANCPILRGPLRLSP